MPDRDSHILVGLVALELGLITRSQLMSAVKAWGKRPRVRLARVLADRKLLSAAQLRSVQREASARAKRDGGASRSLASMKIPRELRKTLLAPPRGPAGVPVGEAVPEAPPPEAKYELGEELGRGGLGRVVEATDAVLGRRVALKMMLGDAPGDVIDRFQWEAKITGRLEHPNIVPVHELGRLPETGEVFFSMKKISGRDLSWQIHHGDWPLRRQVEAFRDVCRAVAYAHSKGIIHRDLKPANVMLGDFGETLVVDWGLARVLGESEPAPGRAPRAPGSERVASSSESTHLTMEGDVLGTPSYMPPEQALGRLSQLDERSDVWSLGAILYEILTKHPPFEGGGPWDVVESVIRDPVKPPSAWAPAPPELEAICLRALSKKREDRYASAADLAREVDLFLEGTKERERREELAASQVERARREIGRWNEATAAARQAHAQADAWIREVPPGSGPEAFRRAWGEKDRARSADRESALAFSDAHAALTSALSILPGHAEARRLQAELFWERFLEAETARDEKGMVIFRRVAEECNDGVLDARLSGDGTVTIRSRAWACPCLAKGRPVRPEELWVSEYHPWSGRRRTGVTVESLPELELSDALTLRVHGPGCRCESLAGADVWAFRYEEIDRVLVPRTHGTSSRPIPPAVLDELFGDSPYRPRGGGVHVGVTPLDRVPWPMGSWLFILVASGRAPQRLPFDVRREAVLEFDVTLYARDEVPGPALPVAGGTFRFHEEPATEGYPASPMEIVRVHDFLVMRHPVTCREYLEFLNDLHRADPAAAALRVPRAGEASDPFWPLSAEGYAVPDEGWLKRTGAPPRKHRLMSTMADWHADWPVMAVSWGDGLAYARWRSLREGRLYTLPLEVQWELAARGFDGRVLPWGNGWHDQLCNFRDAFPGATKPATIQEFPFDESPFGGRGMAGNSGDWGLNDPGDKYRGLRPVRGGAWVHVPNMCRTHRRSGQGYRTPFMAAGIRLFGIVRTGEAWAGGGAAPGTGHGSRA